MAQRLVLKTTFENESVYRLFRDAAFLKHKNNRRVVELLKRKTAQIVTRLELKHLDSSDPGLAVIVEVFEQISE